MRWANVVGAGLMVWAVSCFEDSPPVADSGPAATTDGCADGTEGCPCIEDECVGELVCLSDTCVDPGGTGEDSGRATGMDSGPIATGDVTGASETADPPEPPMTGGVGMLPPGADCHPLDDQCMPGLACVGLAEFSMFCDEPGPLNPGDECGDPLGCGPLQLCIAASAFENCNGIGCCAPICDVSQGNRQCGSPSVCDPFYPRGKAPGYADVGVCVDFV